MSWLMLRRLTRCFKLGNADSCSRILSLQTMEWSRVCKAWTWKAWSSRFKYWSLVYFSTASIPARPVIVKCSYIWYEICIFYKMCILTFAVIWLEESASAINACHLTFQIRLHHQCDIFESGTLKSGLQFSIHSGSIRFESLQSVHSLDLDSLVSNCILSSCITYIHPKLNCI